MLMLMLMNFSWGAFRIDAIVKEEIWENRKESLPFTFQIMPACNKKEETYIHGPIYVTIHPSWDKNGEKVKGELMMIASIHTLPNKWLSFRKEENKYLKEALKEEILSSIKSVLPLNKHLLYAEAGTPSTYNKFIGKAKVGGFPLTVRNAILRPKSMRTLHPQLYIAGEQVFPGPGTLSSA